VLEALSLEIRAVGIDRTRVHATVARAGLTTGALYSRWQALEELMVGLWAERLAPRLKSLFEAALAATTDPDGAEARRLEASLEAASRCIEDDVLADFLLASRRFQDLKRAMSVEISGWLDVPRAGGFKRETMVAILGAVTGQLIHGGFSREKSFAWARLFADLAAASHSPRKFRVLKLRPAPLGTIERVSEDPARLRLITAAAAVIARSGMDGATVSRIGRLAGVDGTVLYRRYAGVEELLLDALRAHVALNVEADVKVISDAYAREESAEVTAAVAIAALGSPEREQWRELHYESLLAARVRPEIGDDVRERFDGRLANLRRAGSRKSRVAARHPARDQVRFYQTLTLGTGVLIHCVGLQVRQMPALQRTFAHVFDAARKRVLAVGPPPRIGPGLARPKP
jgi:AcrR family transcriptional regulator